MRCCAAVLCAALAGPLAADVVVVENATGNISVRVVDRDDVGVRGRTQDRAIRPDDIRIEQKEAAGLFVRAEPADGASVHLELEVPYQTSLGLTTVSGKILVEGMPAALDVETETGDLEFALPWYSSYLDFEAAREPQQLQVPDHLNQRRKKQALQLRQHRRVGRDYRGYTDVRVRTQASRVVELREIAIPEDSPIKLHWQGPEALENLFGVEGPVRLEERSAPDVERKPESQADFRTDVGLVDLLVHAADDQGRVLSDLEQDDFRVTENGVPQQIRAVRKVDIPVNIVVFLDWNKQLFGKLVLSLQAVDRFIQTLRDGDKMALHALVSNIVYMVPRLTDDLNELRDGLTALNLLHVSHVKAGPTRLGGASSLWDPMLVSMTDELPKHDDELNLFVPITFGVDIFSEVPFPKVRRAVEQMARELNILFYPIAVGHHLQPPNPRTWGEYVEAGRKHLGVLAKAGGGRVFEAETPEQIGGVLERILAEVGSAYAVSYAPSDQDYDGEWRSIQVEVARPNVTLRHRPGYLAHP